MKAKHRIAIVGIGGIAEIHARAIAELQNAVLVAGSCRSEEKGRAFAKKWNCEWSADWEKMMDAAKPDVVAICTPSGAHLEPALAAFNRGIHVLCEKPLDISIARADQMIAAADKAKVALGGVFPQRFNPAVIAVREAIKAGRFGQIAVIAAAVPWWRQDSYYSKDRWQGKLAWDGGGALINQSIHQVDLMQWLAAAAQPQADRALNPVKQLFCMADRLGHSEPSMEVEDTALMVAKFRNGAMGQILAATSMYPGSMWSITVSGRNGTAKVTGDQLVEFQFRDPLPEDDELRKRFGQQTGHTGGSADPLAIPYKNHAENYVEFLGAIDSGRSPLIDGVESRKALEIVRACYDSAARGVAVTLGA